MKTLNIGKDFSTDPIGRFRTDSEFSGEAFREDVLRAKIASLGPNEKLKIILDDNVEGYGSSFLSEGFAGLVKFGYLDKDSLLDKLEFEYSDSDFEFYKNKIIQYIRESSYKSEEYSPTK